MDIIIKLITMQIALQILAQDIVETNYLDSDECAITRALVRAGYIMYRHVGRDIRHSDGKFDDQVILCDKYDSNLDDLTDKVWNMYHRLEPPQDFTFTLVNKE